LLQTPDLYPAGRTRISLRRTGEVFSHVPPQAKVHNLVLGRTWIDSYGTFLVTNTATGDKVQLEFKPCGWFGAGQYEFEGHVMDAEVSWVRLRLLFGYAVGLGPGAQRTSQSASGQAGGCS
jgi:hypothetical protein